MVDLTKELQSLKESSHQSLIDALHGEQKEIQQKIHIISILKIIEDFKKLYDEKFFIKYNITDLRVKFNSVGNSTTGKIYFVFFSKGNPLKRSYSGTIEYLLYKKARQVLEQLNNINKIFLNEDFLNSQEDTFIQIKNTDSFEELKNLLLSNELNAFLNYSLMNKNLSKKETKESKLKV